VCLTTLVTRKVAEGVRMYSQQSWKELVGNRGKELVEANIGCVVDFYTQQADASNHAVREAACACIAELGDKIDKRCLSPHVLRLLEVLIACFRDERSVLVNCAFAQRMCIVPAFLCPENGVVGDCCSWPVRDAACIACGNFLRCFPTESAPHLDELFVLFFAHVTDPIWSVREDAAVALGSVVGAYGEDAFAKVHAELRLLLPAAKQQAANSSVRPAQINRIARFASKLSSSGL
jgi:hypothetical protein